MGARSARKRKWYDKVKPEIRDSFIRIRDLFRSGEITAPMQRVYEEFTQYHKIDLGFSVFRLALLEKDNVVR